MAFPPVFTGNGNFYDSRDIGCRNELLHANSCRNGIMPIPGRADNPFMFITYEHLCDSIIRAAS